MSSSVAIEGDATRSAVSIRGKYILVVCGVAALAAAMLGGFNYYWVERTAREQAYARLLAAAELIAPRVQFAYARLGGDATAISRMPPFQGIIRAAGNQGIDVLDASTAGQWADRLHVIFRSILEIRPDYLQMRFVGLADNGQELVRTDRRADGIRRLPDEQLQQKLDRDYLQEALLLRPGAVYFSRITPNVDFGVTDFDQQLLRAVTQVRDRDGRLFGFMVINADYQALVRDLLQDVQARGRVFVVNGSGAYIRRDPDGTTSRLIHKGEMAYDLPAGGEPLNADGSVRLSADGRTIYATADVSDRRSDGPGRSLSVILAQPAAEVMAPVAENGRQVLVLSALLLGLASVLAFLLADSVVRPLRKAIAAIQAYRPGEDSPDLPTERPDEIGALSRAFAQLLDTLRQSRAAEQRSHDRLSAIMDNSVDALITIDARGRILHYNKGAQAIFGHRPEAMIGCNIKVLMPEPVRSAHDGYLRNYAETGRAQIIGSTRELTGLAADGRQIPLELTVSEIHSGGDILYSGIMRDISERKAMQHRIQEQADDLRRSNRDLEDFAYIASHDLKEPLRAITNHVQFLKEDYEAAIDDDGRQRIARIQMLCGRADALISSLLEFSRLGRSEFAIGDFEMSALAAEIADGLDDTLKAAGAEVVLATPLPPVHGDRVRIGSLLYNLIVNGIKYNDSTQKRIEVGYDPAAAAAGGPAGAFYVRDNGIGIPDNQQDAVFKIFKRLHNEKAYGAGTGVGLSFARKIVERHGGQLWLRSVPGEGTTFYFNLDLAERHVAA